MKLIDEIVESKIIDFSTNNIDIDDSLLKKGSKELDIFFVLDKAILFDEYMKLKNKIIDILKVLPVKTNITIGYKDEGLDLDDFLVYLKNILEKLCASSPRFQIFDLKACDICDKTITFTVPGGSLGVEELLKPIKDEFASFGLDIILELKYDVASSIKAQLEALEKEKEMILADQQREAMKAAAFNKEAANSKFKYKKKFTPDSVTSIKNIPSNSNDLSLYIGENGNATFMIKAYVFDFTFKEFATTKSCLLTLQVTDETDSIIVKKWLRADDEKKIYLEQIKNNIELKIIGDASVDNFTKNKEVVLTATEIEMIGEHKIDYGTDDAPVKRVELHAHTKMSTLDGLTEVPEYLKIVSKWGHNSMAFTDHAGVYAFADVDHEIHNYPDFKPLFGVELGFVDDKDYFITFDKRDIPLRDAVYVVYDIETTGLSQDHDRIIEIAACKMYQGGIIDTYETFVNPKMPISEKITELTTITDAMVKDAKTIQEILPEFLEFCKGSILVAHNAKFDVGFIYANIKRLGLDYPVLPAIDTLNLFRAGYYDKVKRFNLKELSKYFKVKQEQHHRAIDDTRVTALCFSLMLNDLYQKNITNYQDINSLIDESEHWKHVFPSQITVLAKTQDGFKNMYKLLSDALTVHFYGDARALRSVIEKYRDGILIGSGGQTGSIFENALNRSDEDVALAMDYYDYIEVQPPLAYAHLFDSFIDGEAIIKDTIKKIIRIAKEKGKMVVATSHCHYSRPYLKKYRDILINSPQIGGGIHPLAKYKVSPDMHLRTTNEMLEEFNFLDEKLAYEIVVENTNAIADSIDKIQIFKKDMFAPRDDQFKDSILQVPSITDEVRRVVESNVEKLYGNNPHSIVKERVKRELDSIISNGYASVYYVSHLLVVKSLSDGYLVGSRGSVGSSLVATMMDITEINPLSPHYRCPKCKFHTFKMNDEEKARYGIREEEKQFVSILDTVESGYDLPDTVCPICGEKLKKDGHDIPFETFLGFNGDKIPDIDLNFSGEYQAKAHEYIRSVFGPENSFRAGTVGTIADNIAYGYVKGYCERKGIELRPCEMDRRSKFLVGIKRSTGQHPGGIVVVPNYVDVYDVTPIQFPADKTDNAWRTTHYDYHSFESNLLKFDILGHDDPTIIKYLMDYVHAHQSEFPFVDPQDIPIDDKNVYRLFNSTDVIGLTEEQLSSPVSSYAVPEFGTNFVRQMLVETLPKTFAQLVKISGLSHGTDVWRTNAQDLVSGSSPYGKIDFKDVIGCRDDIMVDLLYMGLEPIKAFEIMEFVRKGKVAGNPEKWAKYKALMIEKNVPEWYIWSCERIKYMFPKAHATAYVLMALRIAWFKVNSPALFYSAWFSKRAKSYDVQAFLSGPLAIKAKIAELQTKKDSTAKDEDAITALQVALEMTSRGIKFLNVDINISSANIFEVEDGNLRLPFIAVDRLGESVAFDIVEKRNEAPFTSKKDVLKRTRLNNTLFEEFNLMHVFGALPEQDKEEELGIFAFAE